MGTSLTSGPTDNIGLRLWKNDVAAIIALGKSTPIYMYDCGLAGALTTQFIANTWMVVNLKPAMCVIEYASNDARTTNGISVAQHKTNLLTGIAAIKAGTPSTKLMLMTTNPMLGDVAADKPLMNDYYQNIRDIAAADPTIGLIDTTPLWGTPTLVQIPDGGHPTLAAMRAVSVPYIASVIAPYIS